jgi:hypothetical protein
MNFFVCNFLRLPVPSSLSSTHTFFNSLILSILDMYSSVGMWHQISCPYKTRGKVKLSLCLTNSAFRPEDVWGSRCTDPVFLTSALLWGEWSASRPDRFTPWERTSGTHWIGGWMEKEKKGKIVSLPGLELRPPSRPVRNQSLYRLC